MTAIDATALLMSAAAFAVACAALLLSLDNRRK